MAARLRGWRAGWRKGRLKAAWSKCRDPWSPNNNHQQAPKNDLHFGGLLRGMLRGYASGCASGVCFARAPPSTNTYLGPRKKILTYIYIIKKCCFLKSPGVLTRRLWNWCLVVNDRCNMQNRGIRMSPVSKFAHGIDCITQHVVFLMGYPFEHLFGSTKIGLSAPHLCVSSCFWLCTPVRIRSSSSSPSSSSSRLLLLPPPPSHTTLANTTCSHTSLSHTTYSHTQLSHKQLSHKQLSHTTCLHRTLSHTTYSHTTCSHTTLSHTTCSHTTLSNTHNLLTHNSHT